MNKIKTNNQLEYLCPTLILSYFLLHNIFLVLIGIGFSVYLINIKVINNIVRSIKQILIEQNESKFANINDKAKKYNYGNRELCEKESELTLVETIEELGFIPSLNQNEKDKAA